MAVVNSCFKMLDSVQITNETLSQENPLEFKPTIIDFNRTMIRIKFNFVSP